MTTPGRGNYAGGIYRNAWNTRIRQYLVPSGFDMSAKRTMTLVVIDRWPHLVGAAG
jgi:hypothetical protein